MALRARRPNDGLVDYLAGVQPDRERPRLELVEQPIQQRSSDGDACVGLTLSGFYGAAFIVIAVLFGPALLELVMEWVL